ncbi:MAG: hypothetical protein AAFX81_07820 [Pseudomonadota bacterium]
MGATKIMVIRHAEKPAHYAGHAYRGVTPAGHRSDKSLVTLGWERAGALVTLFAPPHGPLAPHLATPEHLVAADPDEEAEDGAHHGHHDEPSQRPYQTVSGIAAKLGLTIDKAFAKDAFADMADAALARSGVVLISWQHQDIPDLCRHVLKQTDTPADRFALPPKWHGDRYDLVWVFDRPSGDGPITGFVQVPQLLLAGDRESVLPTG